MSLKPVPLKWAMFWFLINLAFLGLFLGLTIDSWGNWRDMILYGGMAVLFGALAKWRRDQCV